MSTHVIGTWLFPHGPLPFPHLPWTSSTGRGPTALGKGTRATIRPPSPCMMVASHSFSPRPGFHPRLPNSKWSTCPRRGAGVRGGACRGPVELGWSRGTAVPQQSCWASLWLGEPRAKAWRWWKLKGHRKHPNKGPCITANCMALPDPSYFIPG